MVGRIIVVGIVVGCCVSVVVGCCGRLLWQLLW